MQTPDNKAGLITEQVMSIFRQRDDDKLWEISTPNYNKIYSHVYDTLCKHDLDKENTDEIKG